MSAFCYDSPGVQQLETLLPDAFSCCHEENKTLTLGALSNALAGYTPASTLQNRDDLILLAGKKAAALLGPEAAHALRCSLEESFSALTANHHAITTVPDFTQGTLIYGLRLLAQNCPDRALPVFAAGGVPMSDFSYPCGVLVGRPRNPHSTFGVRLRLLRPSARKTLVSCQAAFCAQDVALASSRIKTSQWLPYEQAALSRVVEDILSLPDVLAQQRYSHQCTIINARLWHRLFKPGVPVPPLVMLDKLELERDLLIADVQNKNSLAHALIFDPELRSAVVRRLNGARGCWTCEDPDGGSAPIRGTVLFWGIDPKGRMMPLCLDQKAGHLFCPKDPSFRKNLTPTVIAQALRNNRILPGLYMGFSAIALARGLLCCGGLFQTGYLRRMRTVTAACLAEAGYGDMAACLTALPDAPLTSGFLPLGFNNGVNPPYAAGAVELLAAGGISADDLNALGAMPLRQALEPAFPYMYELAIPTGERHPGWTETLRRGYLLELTPEN